MGQTMSEPIVAKETSVLQNANYKVGSSCMQGWRIAMEDAHVHMLQLDQDRQASFFGIYDGHGGSAVAHYLSNHLHKFVLRRKEYQEGKITHALQMGFLDCDNAIKEFIGEDAINCGSTAITVLIKDEKIYACNVGDSRGIIGANGMVEALSIDHKPCDPLELRRIEDAGGFLENNRVNGVLALSRALGDFCFKQNSSLVAKDQVVSPFPDVLVKDISDKWNFLILACDGIWDVMSNEEAVRFVTRLIGKGMEPEDICEEMMTFCLSDVCSMSSVGCDNMTVMIICFLHNKPYSCLVEKCDKIEKELQRLDEERSSYINSRNASVLSSSGDTEDEKNINSPTDGVANDIGCSSCCSGTEVEDEENYQFKKKNVTRLNCSSIHQSDTLEHSRQDQISE